METPVLNLYPFSACDKMKGKSMEASNVIKIKAKTWEEIYEEERPPDYGGPHHSRVFRKDVNVKRFSDIESFQKELSQFDRCSYSQCTLTGNEFVLEGGILFSIERGNLNSVRCLELKLTIKDPCELSEILAWIYQMLNKIIPK